MVAAAVLLAAAACSDDRVVLSEFMASNDATLADDDGDFVDWIELHNPGATSVNLDGWFLTDDIAIPRRYRLPEVRLGAGEYVIVFASGKNHVTAGEPLHTNFRLQATSGYLALLRPSGFLASEYRPYPDQRTDLSFGLVASGDAAYLAHPTPGRANAPETSPP